MCASEFGMWAHTDPCRRMESDCFVKSARFWVYLVPFDDLFGIIRHGSGQKRIIKLINNMFDSTAKRMYQVSVVSVRTGS